MPPLFSNMASVSSSICAVSSGPKLPLIAVPPPVPAKTAMVPQPSEPLSSGPLYLAATLGQIAFDLEKGRGKASFEARYKTDVCAAQSEEEYAGMISNSCVVEHCRRS